MPFRPAVAAVASLLLAGCAAPTAPTAAQVKRAAVPATAPATTAAGLQFLSIDFATVRTARASCFVVRAGAGSAVVTCAHVVPVGATPLGVVTALVRAMGN